MAGHPQSDADLCIREATTADSRQIVLLGQAFAAALRLVPCDIASLEATIEGFLASEVGVIFVAELDGHIVGMLGATLAPMFLNHAYRLAQEVAWYVTPNARGEQLGRGLLLRFEAWARARGAHAVCMSALASNPSVAEVYSAQGYALYESHYMKRL